MDSLIKFVAGAIVAFALFWLGLYIIPSLLVILITLVVTLSPFICIGLVVWAIVVLFRRR